MDIYPRRSGPHRRLKLSILMVRRDRPFPNFIEIKSLALQRFDPRDYEVIVLDDSTTTETPAVFDRFRSQLNLRFFHFHGWDRAEDVFVGPHGRKSLATHMNYGIRKARGEIIILESGEYVHLGESLQAMWEVHQDTKKLLYHGGVRTIETNAFESHNWDQHPEALFQRQDIWGEVICPPYVSDPEGFSFCSVPRSLLMALGGYDHAFTQGYGCEDEELIRRIRQSGAMMGSASRYIVGHLSHEDAQGAQGTQPPVNYRAMQRNRLLKDQGYYEDDTRVKYYRPGIEKRPIVANEGLRWGRLPRGVECWTLDETLERLPS